VVALLLMALVACDAAPELDPRPREGWYQEPAAWSWTGDALEAAIGREAVWVPLETPARALALMVDGPLDDPAWTVTGRDAAGRTMEPVAIAWTWHEGLAHVGRVALPTPAVAVRMQGAGATAVQVEALVEVPDWQRPLAATLPLAVEEPQDKATLPAWVITRAGWGARSTPVCGSAHTPRFVTVHHTATPNNDTLSPAARMRQMQAYHIDALGWCDFGYHFTVGIDGRVYQGRTQATRTGSHVGNHNTNNVGVSVVGNFVSFDPRTVQIDGLVQIGTWITGTWGIPRTRDRILGHRDWSGHRSNACPGDRLYAQLGAIIRRMGGASAPPPPSCPAVCAPGAARCSAGGQVERCADHSGDGCATWGGAVACGCGQTCQTGVCVSDPSICCPAPVEGATGVFADLVDGSPGVRIAEQLFEQGITSGCSASPRLFCPGCRIPRAQAAAFVAAGLGLPTPVPAVARFEDVPTTHPQAGAIEALAEAGILAGCQASPARFCPDDTLTRAQAGQIIARARGGDLDASAQRVFEDVPADAWYRPAVETLHRACVVAGCGTEPLRYCPERAVTRLEFGTLLLRGLGLDADADRTPCCRPEPLAGATGTFGDVPDLDPFAPLAQAWFDAGITAGCRAEPRLFCRQCGVTRAQGMTLLARAMALDLEPPAVAPFADVPVDHPDAAAIAALVDRGVVQGCDLARGRFCPDTSLSRAQTAALLVRVLGVDGDGAPDPELLDVPADAWFAPAVAALFDACILDTCTSGVRRFCPADPVRREDFAWWVSRTLRIGGETNCLVAPDADDGTPDPATPDAGLSDDNGGDTETGPDRDASAGDDGSGSPDASLPPDAADPAQPPGTDAGSGGLSPPPAPGGGDASRAEPAPGSPRVVSGGGGCRQAGNPASSLPWLALGLGLVAWRRGSGGQPGRV
jgi:hypothetical protein